MDAIFDFIIGIWQDLPVWAWCLIIPAALLVWLILMVFIEGAPPASTAAERGIRQVDALYDAAEREVIRRAAAWRE